MARFTMGSFAGILITSLLLFIIASIFLPFLIPFFSNDHPINTENAAGPLKLLFHFMADPSLSWIKMLLVIPLAMIWFIVNW